MRPTSSNPSLLSTPEPGCQLCKPITSMIFLFTIIILALVFEYITGFHDAAISIATIVATKVLTPFQAVLWAAIFNFAPFFIFKYFIGELKIGNTIAHFVDRAFVTMPVIF